MARRGQGATEYLVIFGAVLLVSAIVVSAIGATSGTDASVKMQQASAAWKGASPFAITSFKLSSSDIALAVSDSMKKELELTQVVFGDGADAIDLWAPSGSATQSFFAGTYSTTLSNSSFGVPGNPCYGKPVGTSFEFGSVTFVYADGSISGIRQVGPALSGQCSANASVSGAQPAGATPSPSAGATSTPTPTPSVAATPSPTPTPSPSPSPAPYAMLSGWVRDANGAGVSGAVVNLTNSTPSQPAVANASGYYSLNVSLGAQSAVFAASVSANFSYTPSAAVLSFAAGSPASRDFTLGFQNASIHGMVSDANGDAVSGANVSWGAYSAVTAANGNYLVSGIVMAGLSSSDTMVVSKSPVYSPRSLDVSVSAGSASVADFNSMYSRELDFVSSAVTGYVRDPSSAGISGVNVSCGDYFSSTAGDGLFAISGIAMSNATSACTLNASKFPTFNSNLTNVSLSAGGTSAQDLRLSYANASVSGFIRDGSSAGVSGATVSCGAFSTASTSDGSYAINGITMSSASSSCTLAASKSGYTSNSTTVSLTAGAATSSQNLVLNLIVNGVCGPANGFGRASIPSGADACSAGTVSAVSGSNPWSWFCNGSYGGTNASCATINATYTPTVTSFTTVGTTTWTVPAGVSSVDYLVVAGGGGGGGFRGGGGGGGGFRTASGYPVTSGTAYTITVGAGGAGGAATSPGGYGYAGSNSSFYTVVSIGGGFGGDAAGGNGGSGGGGSTTSGGSGTSGQGNDGGSGSTACGTYSIGGGGGGASGTGIATVECVAGGGGAGASSSINGSAITYAGGGGGGTRCGYTPGSGGSGGGGSGGAQANGVAGTNGLGGGGGGGGRCDGAQTYAGAAGGSGIVILRYVIVTNGSCGSSNGQNLYSAPSTNLCSVGSASSVSGSGPWSWTCSGSNGGASTSCSANLAVNGVCGSSNGAGFYSVPTTNFCSAGSASVVSGSGPWSWFCNGSYGGTNASCSALLKVDGACGAANGHYRSSTPAGTDACTSGTITGMSGSYSWTCTGANGGSSPSCATAAATYTVAQFTTVGTTTWTAPAGVSSVDYLVVGGGGGGGTYYKSGGGGAGGFLSGTGFAVSGTVNIIVGGGGAAGASGGNSVFSSITAYGGGYGAAYTTNVGSGGSGGGASSWYTTGGSGTSGQGNSGGSGVYSAPAYGCGGGGGAGAAGSPGTSSTGGNGGAGLSSSINGTTVYYAGGGGGSSDTGLGSGGLGGGGAAGSNSGSIAPTAGTNGLGGGGGGGGGYANLGAAGGSGIVIIRYINNS